MEEYGRQTVGRRHLGGWRVGLGCRGNWAVTEGACNHGDPQIDSSNLP